MSTTTSDGTRSCTECRRADDLRNVSRRSLLKALGVGAAAGAGLSLASSRVAFASGAWVGDTIVVLSLRGGFDGLSAVAPIGDAEYLNLRPSIAIRESSAIRLDPMFGMHPAMAPLTPFWQKGKLAFVHATGLPDPNRSHFQAMDELERATPGSSARSGWLDRTLGLHTDDGPFGAVQLGSTDMPYAFAGPHQELGMDSLASFKLSGVDTAARPAWQTALTSLHDAADTAFASSAGITLDALGAAAQFQTTYAPANGAAYPDSDLGRALADAARLIKANLGTRVITIDEGDWDMHAGLGRVDNGWMFDKLTDLSKSLAAFATDLGADLDRVTLLTISEFGRRAQENESNGVDHGWGNAMMILGGHVNAGVHGTWPGLSADALVDGDLRATTDYRAVLADVLANRCGAGADDLATVFPGWRGATLGITSP